MAKGTEDHVGFLAPQSKQSLLAGEVRLAFSKSAKDVLFGASAAMMVRWSGMWWCGEMVRCCDAEVELPGELEVPRGCCHFKGPAGFGHVFLTIFIR